MLNEAQIIARLEKFFPKYIGDDAAVIKVSAKKSYLVTKDLLVEDIHFRKKYFDPLSLAHKALHVNLSDLAAMGAKPEFILCGISIPISYQKYSTDFLYHFARLCEKEKVILIGGDTTRSPDKLFISITAIGTALTKNIKYRSTAEINDLICVAGNLGVAHLGLSFFEKSLFGGKKFKKIFLRPDAKVKEGQWLANQSCVTSMMDLSDGLYIDLKRLCQQSKVSGNLELERFVPTADFISSCNLVGFDPIETMLTGGEDYSLLFTVKKAKYQKLFSKFKKKFGYEVKHIGHISAGSGIRFTRNGKHEALQLKPFSHFGEL
jgi:thiamine-monophosphate kinase